MVEKPQDVFTMLKRIAFRQMKSSLNFNRRMVEGRFEQEELTSCVHLFNQTVIAQSSCGHFVHEG